MDDRDEKQLEELIHRALKQLPDLSAPETLLHRVMLEVHARARQPWWKRSWLGWPLGIQLLSLAMLLPSAGLVSYLIGAAWDGVNGTSISARISEWLANYAPILETVKTLSNALLVLARQVGQPLLFFALGSSLLIYFACVGLGTVCLRFAFKRA